MQCFLDLRVKRKSLNWQRPNGYIWLWTTIFSAKIRLEELGRSDINFFLSRQWDRCMKLFQLNLQRSILVNQRPTFIFSTHLLSKSHANLHYLSSKCVNIQARLRLIWSNAKTGVVIMLNIVLSRDFPDVMWLFMRLFTQNRSLTEGLMGRKSIGIFIAFMIFDYLYGEMYIVIFVWCLIMPENDYKDIFANSLNTAEPHNFLRQNSSQTSKEKLKTFCMVDCFLCISTPFLLQMVQPGKSPAPSQKPPFVSTIQLNGNKRACNMAGRIPPFGHLLFATIVGIASGVYIFQPWYFIQFNERHQHGLSIMAGLDQALDEEEISCNLDASTDKWKLDRARRILFEMSKYVWRLFIDIKVICQS